MKMLVCLFFVFAVAQAEIDWAKHLTGTTNILKLNNPRIVGGQEAKPHQFPWQVYLETNSPQGSFTCGGSLISRNWVLTAAHCVDKGVYAVRVTLGAHNKNTFEEGQIRVLTNEFLIHENWNNVEDDIALIRLPKPIELSERIQPVQLPSRSEANNTFTGTLATVSGWGRTCNEPGSGSDVLRFIQKPIISNAECGEIMKDEPIAILDSFICADGSQGQSACHGDSGGPLIVGDRTQVGIVSWGSGSGCEAGFAQVFTRITSYLDWIEKNTDVIIC